MENGHISQTPQAHTASAVILLFFHKQDVNLSINARYTEISHIRLFIFFPLLKIDSNTKYSASILHKYKILAMRVTCQQRKIKNEIIKENQSSDGLCQQNI